MLISEVMILNNLDIKGAIKKAGLKQWQVADIYGINDGNFSRLLRKPLKGEKRVRVLRAIELAKKEYGEDAE